MSGSTLLPEFACLREKDYSSERQIEVPSPTLREDVQMAEPFLTAVALKLAEKLAVELLSASANRVKRRFQNSERQKALTAALAEALKAALDSFALYDESLIIHYEGLFTDFFGRSEVVEELARLLDPGPDQPIDLGLLRREFTDAGFDLTTLVGLNFDAFITRFVNAFYTSAAQEQALQGVIEIRILGQIAEKMKSVATGTERVAEATEESADKLGEISTLVKSALDQQDVSNDLTEAIGTMLKEGFDKTYVGMENIVAAINSSGYDVVTDEAGQVTIKNQGRSASGPDQNVLQQLQTTINQLREAIVGHQPNAQELDLLEERYRKHVIRWFERLTFIGMMQTARPISLPLEDVYVELRAVAEVPEAADAFSVEERRLLLEKDEKGSEEERRELFRQLDTLRRERWSRAIPERKSITSALYQSGKQAFVVLGDPGSGKSTLLHVLALVFARGPDAVQKRLGITPAESDRLPIFVPLAAYDDMARKTEGGLSLPDFLGVYYDRRRGLPGLGPVFKRAMEKGRALILLDGLDEVLNVTSRGFVAEQAAALIGEWSGRGVRFVITSRFVGYREAPLPGDLPHLSVLDFGLQEIATFVHQWAAAYERFVSGLADAQATPEVVREARQHETDLLEDVNSNPSVQRLAANPLMLTMLALLRRQLGIRLPHRRIELYGRYVGTMIENWIEARSRGEREQTVSMLGLHDAERVLIPLALWLQQSKPSGTAGKAEIRERLKQISLEQAGLSISTAAVAELYQAEEKAERFLHDMRGMAGLIVERGQDAFGFLHLTFQEYFAARALALLDAGPRWAIVQPHLHDPRWHEPILLCAGRLGVIENRRPQVTDFVRLILDCDDDSEQDLHRHLLLALAIAADDVNIDPSLLQELAAKASSYLSTKVYLLGRQLIRLLGRLVSNGLVESEDCLLPAFESQDSNLRYAAIESIHEALTSKRIRRLVASRLEDSEEYVSASAVRALSGWVSGDQEVRAAILALLEDNRWSVRMAALEVLSDVASSDQEVRGAILGRLNDNHMAVRAGAVQALSGLAQSDQEVRTVLLAGMEDESSGIQDFLVNALSGSVNSHPDVRAAMFGMLNSDPWYVRTAGINGLSGSVGTDREIQATIFARLKDENSIVRRIAVGALTALVSSDQDVQAALIALLEDENFNVRASALEALRALASSNQDVLAAILVRLGDESPDVRKMAVETLSGSASDNKVVRSAILARLEDPEHIVREASVIALSGLVTTDPEVRTAVLARLDDEDYVVRAAIGALRELISGDPIVLAKIVALFDVRDWETRMTTAQVLGDSLAHASSDQTEILRAITLACRRFGTNESASFVAAGLVALGGLVTSNQDVRAAILVRVNDEDSEVRAAAIEALSGLVISDQDVRAALLARVDDEDGEVRVAAVEALSRLVSSDQDVRAALFLRLEDEYTAVRAAAVEALSQLVSSDREARAALFVRLEDQDAGARAFATHSLSKFVSSDLGVRGAILIRLEDVDYSVRAEALSALKDLVGTDQDVQMSILAHLKDKATVVRGTAFGALSCLLDTEHEVRAASLAWLEDLDNYLQAAAVGALDALVSSDQDVKEMVMLRRRDERSSVRAASIGALSGLLGTDKDVRGVILGDLENESSDVRRAVVLAFSKLVNSDQNLRAAISTRLEAPHNHERSEASETVSGLVSVRSALLARLEDSDPYVREATVTALSGLVNSHPDVRTAILARLEDNEPLVRLASARAAIKGESSEESKTSLAEQPFLAFLCLDTDHLLFDVYEAGPLEKEFTEIREQLATLVGARLQEEPKLLEWVLSQLGNVRWSARVGAITALAKWPGGLPKHLVSMVIDSLDDQRGLESFPARLTAASYLINRDPHSHDAIQVCLEALDYGTEPWEVLGESPDVRRQAAMILGKLEPLNFNLQVYDRLRKVMYEDQDSDVRDAAYSALVRLAALKQSSRDSVNC